MAIDVTTVQPTTPNGAVSDPVQPVVVPDPPIKSITTTQTTQASTGGYGQIVGLVVQIAEIVMVGYLVVLAVQFNNALAKEWVAPVIAMIFAHNSLSPSQWGGGPANS